MIIHEEVRSGSSSTSHHIKGDLDDVLARVRLLFREYPPSGYGTAASIFQTLTTDYYATVTHANSCD